MNGNKGDIAEIDKTAMEATLRRPLSTTQSMPPQPPAAVAWACAVAPSGSSPARQSCCSRCWAPAARMFGMVAAAAAVGEEPGVGPR